MPRFFVRSESVSSGTALISGDDFHHITKVRRIREGDLIEVVVENDGVYYASVSRINEQSLEALLGDCIRSAGILPVVKLYISILKGKNFDLAIQKAVEVGVSAIVPLNSSRTIPDISGSEQKKVERWQKIAAEASKQSLRDHIPEVLEPADFSSVLADAEGTRIIAHPESVISFREVVRFSGIEEPVSLMIGPEGGFSPDEISAAHAAGWISLSFGMTCLRAETAAAVIPAIIIQELG